MLVLCEEVHVWVHMKLTETLPKLQSCCLNTTKQKDPSNKYFEARGSNIRKCSTIFHTALNVNSSLALGHSPQGQG
jgi:hypothetical protein